MFSAVVAENDRAVAKVLVLGDAADDGGGIVVFPVKGVTIMYKSKDKFERMYNPSISAYWQR